MYIMPEKKVINVRLVKGTTKGKSKRKSRAKKPKEKARQKQKQRQTVNVQVSSGGSGGGGTSFIPMPQAPAFDYSLLANLIRPANTVDMPIRAMAAIPEPVQVRAAEEPTLAEAKKQRVPVSMRMSEREAGYESFPTSSGEEETRQEVRRQEKAASVIVGKYAPAIFPSESEMEAGNIRMQPTKEAAARKRKPNETDEQYNMRIVKYEQMLANKSAKERQRTFERKKEEVLSKIPIAEAQAGGATFIGESDVFAMGEK